jgi:hypothetical protein
MENSNALGPWKNFEFRTLTKDDIPKVLEYLNVNFHYDHPITKFLPKDEEFVKVVNHKMEQVLLKSGLDLSFIAIDTSREEQIAGVQLQFIWKKEDAEIQRTSMKIQNPSSFLERRVVDAVYASMDDRRYGIFEEFGVTEVIWNFVASTGRNYRGLGLGSELYRRLVNFLKGNGHKVAFSIFTSPLSRKCASNAGFIEIARSYFRDAKDQDGHAYLPTATDEDFASTMVIKLI